MKTFLKKIFNYLNIEIKRKEFDIHQDGFISLKTDREIKGYVLLGNIIEPFLGEDGFTISNTHTHFYESVQIAKTFKELGFCVDVISYKNNKFIPERKYDIYFASRTNMQRIAELLPDDCIKIVHLDMAHWLFNNTAAMKRCLAIQNRRKVTLPLKSKIQEHNWAIEYADYATIKGNEFAQNTYKYAKKPIFRTNIPTYATYQFPGNKDYNGCRNNFVWFGSRGLIHKGLDLVLEAFAQMPEYNLTVCGPIDGEKEFVQAYYNELYRTKNINTIGWVDVESENFTRVMDNSIALVFPSCSEGGGGSVATCMQTGIIPIISYESAIDISDSYGILLKESSITEIQDAVRNISRKSSDTLKEMTYNSWKYARENHTREVFAEQLREVIVHILNTDSRIRNYKKS